jgi:lysophospholipase L1-like esterase
MWGYGPGIEESGRLAGMYRLMAEGKGVGFFDAGSVAQVSPLDGVHLDDAGHAALGTALAEVIWAELVER